MKKKQKLTDLRLPGGYKPTAIVLIQDQVEDPFDFPGKLCKSNDKQ